MTKCLIDIDDELLLAAQAALGAGTFKEAVRVALEQAASRRRPAWLTPRIDGGLIAAPRGYPLATQ